MQHIVQHDHWKTQLVDKSYNEKLCFEITRKLIQLAIEIKDNDDGRCKLIDSPMIGTFINKLDQATEAFMIYDAGSSI